MNTTTNPATGGQPKGHGAEASALVTADWLTEHLADPRVRVVEIDVSPAPHREGHIPGAVLWDIYTDLKDEAYAFVGHRAFEDLIRRSGIDADSTIVFYGYAPAFGFWLMRRFGHHDVRILDTSRATWQAEGRPWTDVVTPPSTTAYRLGDEVHEVRASIDDVRRLIDDRSHTILDVRSTLEYEGERFWPSGGMQPNGRSGHVPTAVSSPADHYLDESGSFLSIDQLEGCFPASRGGSGVTTYCTIGARASTAWFVLTELLGRADVRVYDGSWAEWGLDPTTTIDR